MEVVITRYTLEEELLLARRLSHKWVAMLHAARDEAETLTQLDEVKLDV